MNWNIVIMETVRDMLTRVGALSLRLIGVLAILLIGWGIAKLIELVIVRVLKLLTLDTIAEKARISEFLEKGSIKYTLSELLGVLAYWLIMLIVVMTALNALQWTVAAELLNNVVAFIPNIFIAIIVLVIGMFVSAGIGGVVRTAASNAGIEQAKLLSQITQVIVVVFAALIALEQLKIGTEIINSTVNIVIAAIGLGLALAFGLGCKDVAGKFVSEIINKLKK